jgi:hypothetical protein
VGGIAIGAGLMASKKLGQENTQGEEK